MDCLVLPLCKLTEGRAVGEMQRNSVFFHLKCLGFPNKVMLWRELLQFVFVKDLWRDYGSQKICSHFLWLHRKYVVGNETWEWFSSVVLEILQRLKKKIEVSFSLWALMWWFFVVVVSLTILFYFLPPPSLLIGCTVSLLQQLPQEFVDSDWQMESLMYAKSIHFRNSIGLNSELIQWGDFLLFFCFILMVGFCNKIYTFKIL